MSDEPQAIETEAPTPGALDPEAVGKLIDEGATLVDVRRPYEFEAGHLAGARNIEMNELVARAAELERDRPLLLYCRTGNRSSMAVDAFREAGYDAHNLAGGLEAWVAEGRPIEPADGEVTAPLPPS
jgi:phage shock protein E